jgi:two-component system, NtrC family, sensor kinase
MSHSSKQVVEIDTWNQKAWLLRVADSSQAYRLSKQALDLSATLRYEKGIAESLRTFGFCNIRLARYQDALLYLNRAFEIFT